MKKKIEIFKYRIKRLITSKYTKYENKMLNNIWKFCEPTTDKYPTKYSYNAEQNRMKLNANAVYGAASAAFNTFHLTEKERARLNEQLERGRIGVLR